MRPDRDPTKNNYKQLLCFNFPRKNTCLVPYVNDINKLQEEIAKKGEKTMEAKLKELGLYELIENFVDVYPKLNEVAQAKAEATLQTLVTYGIHPENMK